MCPVETKIKLSFYLNINLLNMKFKFDILIVLGSRAKTKFTHKQTNVRTFGHFEKFS